MKPEAVCRLLLDAALLNLSSCGNLTLLPTLMQLYLCATKLCFSLFFFFLMCVYMFLCVPRLLGCEHVVVHACGGPRLMLGIIFKSFSTSFSEA